MVDPSGPLKESISSADIHSIKPREKFKSVPFPASQDPAPNISELPPVKVHQKETVSIEAQLEPETIKALQRSTIF